MAVYQMLRRGSRLGRVGVTGFDLCNLGGPFFHSGFPTLGHEEQRVSLLRVGKLTVYLQVSLGGWKGFNWSRLWRRLRIDDNPSTIGELGALTLAQGWRRFCNAASGDQPSTFIKRIGVSNSGANVEAVVVCLINFHV